MCGKLLGVAEANWMYCPKEMWCLWRQSARGGYRHYGGVFGRCHIHPVPTRSGLSDASWVSWKLWEERMVAWWSVRATQSWMSTLTSIFVCLSDKKCTKLFEESHTQKQKMPNNSVFEMWLFLGRLCLWRLSIRMVDFFVGGFHGSSRVEFMGGEWGFMNLTLV